MNKALLQNQYVNGEAHEKSGKWVELRIRRSQLLTVVSELQTATLERGSASQPTPSAKRDTYADADCDGFIEVVAHSPELWGNLGEEGREESVSSSMSECEEGGLVDFFFPKACLKELLSCKTNTEQDYFSHHSTLCPAHVLKSQFADAILATA